MFPIFKTKRFIMREMTDEDVNDMYDYYSNPDMMRFTRTDIHKDKEDTLNRIRNLSSSFTNKKGIAWAIEALETGKVIGDIGLFFISPDSKKAGIGFNISPEFWNKGYCTEALILALNYALLELGVIRVEATSKIDNIGSIRVMEKAGMICEGILRQYSYKNGYYHDVKIFSKIRSDMNPPSLDSAERLGAGNDFT